MASSSPCYSTKEILTIAADRIGLPGAWTQGASFRDIEGNACGSEHAVSFCLYGVMENFLEDGIPGEVCQALRFVIGDVFLSDWNDTPERTQAEVVRAFRNAAASL